MCASPSLPPVHLEHHYIDESRVTDWPLMCSNRAGVISLAHGVSQGYSQSSLRVSVACSHPDFFTICPWPPWHKPCTWVAWEVQTLIDILLGGFTYEKYHSLHFHYSRFIDRSYCSAMRTVKVLRKNQ
jgi:hypothetical protein